MQHNDTEWMQIYQNLLRQHAVPSLHSSMFFVQGVNYRFKLHNYSFLLIDHWVLKYSCDNDKISPLSLDLLVWRTLLRQR